VTIDSLSGTSTQVASVIPGINASTADLAASSTTLTITGAGFDATTPGNNLVILSSGAGLVTSATAISLTVTYTTKPTAGLLSALVISDGVTNGSLTPVATVVPIVTASTANVPVTATTLVITGIGFDPIASHDLVALSSGSGVVTAATATKLTVNFSSPPSLGALSAFVVIDGVGSGSLTQVANVTLLTKIGSFTTVGLTETVGTTAANLAVFNSTVQGNASASVTVSNIGLNKSAALVARYGGTGNSNMYLGGIQNISGRFYAVIQKNVAGVVTTLFKSGTSLTAAQFSGSGLITFEAVGPSLRLFLNGNLMGTAVDSTFTMGNVGIQGGAATKFSGFRASAITLQNATPPFTDNFASTSDGQLSTFWTDQAGDFTLSGNQAIGSSAATNIATLNGATAANASESVTIGSLAPGGFAGLVASYKNNFNMYYAGVRNTGGIFTAEIWKVVGGVQTRIKSVKLTSFGGGLIQFIRTGTSLKLVVGATTVSVTDSSITAAGRVGVRGTEGTVFSSFSTPPANLVYNGDFSLGNTGFTTSYVYSPQNLYPDGVYDIVDNPAHSRLQDTVASYGDHTTGTGLMMAVNCSATPNDLVWSQTIAVTANTNYNFSLWISSWYPNIPVTLDVRFNGTSVGTPTAPNPTGVWNQFSTSWNSGTATSVTISVYNLNAQVSGFDFALDDISLETA
jgi:hypothetical protein